MVALFELVFHLVEIFEKTLLLIALQLEKGA